MSERNFAWKEIRAGAREDVRVGNNSDIADSVLWGRNVSVGSGCRIGPHSPILDNAIIEDGCFIGPNCVIGEPTSGFYRVSESYEFKPTRSGRDSIIRVGSVISENVRIGEQLRTGPYATIR